MTPAHLMARLPPFLLVSSFLNLASGHVLPQPTKTVAFHEINAASYPLAATLAPDDSFLQRRQFNTICGYIGGDPRLPATCSAGSHCVVDIDHDAVGCCPDGGSCTQGVFTDCVDAGSGPQTELNPYVFTCRGDDSCYRNSFEGGFFQYGCGSTSGLATNVVATASGKSAIRLTSLNVPLTDPVTSLAEPTTLGTRRRTSDTDSSSTGASTTGSATTESTGTSSSESTESTESTTEASTTESETSTASETETETETETDSASGTSGTTDPSATDSDESASSGASAPDTDGDNNSRNTGAIIGGTISGVAALVALVVLGVWLWKRKKGNTRQGPGVKPQVQRIGPPLENNHSFAPVPPMQEADKMAPPPPVPVTDQRSMNPIVDHDGPYAEPWDPQSNYGYSAGAVGGTQMEHDEVPLTRDDDFQHGYNSGLGRISEEEPRPGMAISTPGHVSSPIQPYPGPRRDGGGPLWQQNRGPGWF